MPIEGILNKIITRNYKVLKISYHRKNLNFMILNLCFNFYDDNNIYAELYT